jgi:hypothetical protein
MSLRKCALALLLLPVCAVSALAQAPGPESATLPGYLADRGTGVSTSIFGTYVRGGELLVYLFG